MFVPFGLDKTVYLLALLVRCLPFDTVKVNEPDCNVAAAAASIELANGAASRISTEARIYLSSCLRSL